MSLIGSRTQPDASGLSEVSDFTSIVGHESGDSRQKINSVV
ncbi:hypothetical protein [Pontibacter anaerobius]|uniref:Uncharacterized protein n=1 Tax=Pontibacter anaerobius TaxID=2993940 RepID=A0ABT3RKM7_9BACT|nr:hypothetical protein [Pontibacter anaerobius]MCX2742011.1 hypothetical protein [Pontibacter anaerobius]